MTILITGASKGVGEQLAMQLAAENHYLLLVARNKEALSKVSTQCNEIGGPGTSDFIAYDLSRILTDPSDFIDQLNRFTEHLDVLVNNAGMLMNKPFRDITPQQERTIFEVNYFMPAQLIRICLPFMKKSSGASVVNITSMGAVQGSAKFPGLSAYSSSKGALATLTECLAEELKELNIRVNALAFGAVQTEMLEKAFPGYVAGTSPEEMGRFCKWFVTEGWKRMNGKMIPVSDSTP